jgi:hypothetical protein
MPKEYKPGWLYTRKDNPTGEEYAIHMETCWVYFKDDKEKITRYSPEEIKILASGGLSVPSTSHDKDLALVHRVKKIFDGEIINYEPKSGTTDKGKPDESGGGNSNVINQNSGGEVPANTGAGAGNEGEELDLF